MGNHKGYTLNYFINFFSATTSAQWFHDDVWSLTYTPRGVRTSALSAFVGGEAALQAISGGTLASYRALGATPRGRILKALRNRKRTGKVLV